MFHENFPNSKRQHAHTTEKSDEEIKFKFSYTFFENYLEHRANNKGRGQLGLNIFERTQNIAEIHEIIHSKNFIVCRRVC